MLDQPARRRRPRPCREIGRHGKRRAIRRPPARKIADRLTPVAAAPVTSEYIGHSPCVIGHREWIGLVNALLPGKYPQEACRAAFGASHGGQRPVRNSAPAGSPGRESLTRTRDRSLLTRCIPRDSE